MYTVYVLKSITFNKLYIGYTEDLEKRIKDHNKGKTKSIKAYLPYVLVYEEKYADKTEARKRELFLKTGKGREFLAGILRVA